MKTFPCSGCGAPLEFKPDVGALKCPYCGTEVAVPQAEEAVEELDFQEYLAKLSEAEETHEQVTVSCKACGAETTHDPNVVSEECPYCGTPMVLVQSSKRVIKPRAVLPFKVTLDNSRKMFLDWVKSRWFAPSKLKEVAATGKITGVYIPYWTFDADTTNEYSGERGDYKWVHTSDGKKRKLKWRHAGGVVHVQFDDVLILASDSLPRKYCEKLEPWDLANLVVYTDEYLIGFRAESYQLDLVASFGQAQTVMDKGIRREVRRDIGGDVQQIHTLNTDYSNVTFKHILLPVWLSSYRYDNKVFRFLVNARTTEVQGERPWSVVKIVLAILAALAVLGGAGTLYYLYHMGYF